MKSISSLSLIAFLFTYSSLFGQVHKSPTTEEEYNYMTKGYPIQLSSGLDMKKGYMTGSEITFHEGSYTFNFIPLIRASQDSSLVGFIVKALSSVSGSTYWYGLPFGNDELLNRSFENIRTLDDAMTTAFFKSYVRFVHRVQNRY